jgi:hypothetical protein
MDMVSFSLLPSEYFPPHSRFCAIEIGDFPRKFTNFSSFDKTSKFFDLLESSHPPTVGFRLSETQKTWAMTRARELVITQIFSLTGIGGESKGLSVTGLSNPPEKS